MREYQPIVEFPEYLVQGISDDGAYHSVHEDGTVETDDLRLTIVLSGGYRVLIGNDCRLIVTGKGIAVEALREVSTK